MHFFVLDDSWTGLLDDIRIRVTTTGFTGNICLYRYTSGAEDQLECDDATGGLTIEYNLGSSSAGIYALYVSSSSSSQSKTGSYTVWIEKI